MNWKYIDASHRTAYRILANGTVESCLVSAIPPPAGTIDTEDPPPPPTQLQLDSDAARVYDKVLALKGMTFAQLLTHVDNVFSNLSVAQKDDIKVLAVMASIAAKEHWPV